MPVYYYAHVHNAHISIGLKFPDLPAARFTPSITQLLTYRSNLLLDTREDSGDVLYYLSCAAGNHRQPPTQPRDSTSVGLFLYYDPQKYAQCFRKLAAMSQDLQYLCDSWMHVVVSNLILLPCLMNDCMLSLYLKHITAGDIRELFQLLWWIQHWL